MPPVRPRPCSLGATARFLLLLAGTACVAADVPPDPASRPDGDTDVSDSGLAESERAHDAEDEEVSSVEGLCGAELPDPLEAACGDACVVCEAPRIVSNSALGALRGCHRITGGLSLVEDGLDLSPLADVVQIDGTLTLIVDSEPHGLGRLARVGGLAVVGTEGLRGLDSLAIVDGSLHLEQMDDLSPLARVSRASHLTVNTSSVQDLSDLSCLEQVDGNLTLFGNDEMVELGLDLRAPVGHLHVDGLPRLVDLSSIAVGPAPHSVRVSGNAALTALPDLSLVERVGQDLHLADNPLLRDVDLPLL